MGNQKSAFGLEWNREGGCTVFFFPLISVFGKLSVVPD